MSRIDFNHIKDIKNEIVMWTLSDGTATHFTRNHPIKNMYFQPDVAVIKSITYNTTNTTDNGFIYLIESNLNNSLIGSFYELDTSSTGMVTEPNTIIMIKKPIDGISFQLYQVGTSTTNFNTKVPVTGIAAATVATLTISIDFIQVQNDHGPYKIHDQRSER